MKKITQIIDECRNRNWHISISYQNATSHSVEIYTGYVKDYKQIFLTDGHVTVKKAIKKALEFIYKPENQKEICIYCEKSLEDTLHLKHGYDMMYGYYHYECRGKEVAKAQANGTLTIRGEKGKPIKVPKPF